MEVRRPVRLDAVMRDGIGLRDVLVLEVPKAARVPDVVFHTPATSLTLTLKDLRRIRRDRERNHHRPVRLQFRLAGWLSGKGWRRIWRGRRHNGNDWRFQCCWHICILLTFV